MEPLEKFLLTFYVSASSSKSSVRLHTWPGGCWCPQLPGLHPKAYFLYPTSVCLFPAGINKHGLNAQVQTQGAWFSPHSHIQGRTEATAGRSPPTATSPPRICSKPGDVRPTAASPAVVPPGSDAACETPAYLPHPGHSYVSADNGGPLHAVCAKKPRAAPASPTHRLRCTSQGQTPTRSGCTRGQTPWTSPWTVIRLRSGCFFSLADLLGPGTTPRCYWPTGTQRPTPCVTWQLPISSSFLCGRVVYDLYYCFHSV